MTTIAHSEREAALIETARRVLPGGSFGNLPGDIVIARGPRPAASGMSAATNTSISCSAPARCSSATAIPR